MNQASAAARSRPASPVTWAIVLFALAVLAIAALIPLTLMSHQIFNGAVPLVIGVPSAGVGVLVARRQPRNPLGWLFLTIALCLIVATDGGDYAFLDYSLGHHLPLGLVAAVLDQLWGPGIVLLAVVILLFPDGRLPSAGWRWALRAYWAAYVIMLAGITVGTADAVIGHPIHLDQNASLKTTSPAIFSAVKAVVVIAVLLLSLSFVARQALSWRHARGEQRQQLKWLASGAAATACCTILVTFGGPGGPLFGLAWFGFAALPVSIGVGILKFRLYEIDRIISRTLAYASVTALLVGFYTGIVLLTTRVLSFSSPVAVAASTLAAAALFSPLRRRVQRAVDRRFNRARYDADRTIAAFATRLQDAVDPDAVRADLTAVVRASLEPAHTSLWLTGGPG
jgi:hypothetical protein